MGRNPLHARVWRGAVNAPAPRMAGGASRRRAAGGELSAHAAPRFRAEIEAQLVSPWLARKDADYWVDVLYDFAHELGATTMRTSLSRTVDRRESRSVRRVAVSGPGDHRPVPARNLRRRAAVQDRPRARCRRDRAPARASISIPITGARGRTRAPARETRRAWCCTTRIRSARACRGCSTANCRSSTSAPTTARPATPALTAAHREDLRRLGVLARDQWPLPRRLDHAPLWQARKAASTRCRWSWPCAATCTNPTDGLTEDNWPAPLEDAHAAHAARRAARHSRRLHRIRDW